MPDLEPSVLLLLELAGVVLIETERFNLLKFAIVLSLFPAGLVDVPLRLTFLLVLFVVDDAVGHAHLVRQSLQILLSNSLVGLWLLRLAESWTGAMLSEGVAGSLLAHVSEGVPASLLRLSTLIGEESVHF